MRTLSPKISLTPSLRRRGIIPLFVKAGENARLSLAAYILLVILFLCPLSFAQDLFPGNGAASGDNLTPVDLCPVHLSLSTPSFPVNGNFIAAQPNYSWTGPSTGVAVGLSNYQIQVSSNDSSFASTVVDVLTPVSVNTNLATADGTYTAAYTLVEATTYYWRVRAASFAGNYGPWSQNPGFVVDLSSPPPPAMAAVVPADGSNLGTPDPTLDWENVTDTGGSGLNSYEVQLATVSNFSIIAFSSQPVASVARPTGLAGYLYYWRTRASDNAGNTGVWSSTRSFRVALSSPTITNNIPAGGDIVWRNTNNGIYNMDFNDMGGSLLSRVEVKVTSGMGQTGTVFADWTPIITNINAPSYVADWSLTSGLWNSLQSWATNYISVRVVDYSSNTYTLDDAFKVLKDTVPPTSVNSESGGDLSWLKTARSGGYSVGFADGVSGLAGAKYAVRTSSGGNPPVRISSTAIAGVGGTAYSTPWSVDFNALEDSVTNYVSVEFYDIAGNTVTITDAFIVLKDTTAPSYVNGEVGGDLVWRKAAKAGGYNVDFSDLGSKLAGAKYAVRTSSGGNPPVRISSTAIAGIGGAAYTSDWAVDFDSLAGDSTNYVSVEFYDTVGNTTTITDVFKVLKDTTPPSGISAVIAGIGDSTVSISASGSDTGSRIMDYNYEFSLSEAFDGGISSSNFTGNSFTFTGLNDGATYYLRSYARDNAYNLSDPSAAVSTMTSGIVYFTAQSTAPATLLQGTSIAFLIFDVNTNPGRSANLSQVKVAKLGNIPNSDIAAVYIYRDDGDGTFGPGDSQIGSDAVVAGTAAINITPQLIDNAGKRFFAVYALSASAGVGKTIGARLDAVSNLTFTYPFRAVGTFPVDSVSAVVADQANMLNITPSSLTAGVVQAGVLNLPVVKFAMQTDYGISRMDKLLLRLGGTASVNYINAVKIYRDSNLTGVFDGGDTLITSGGDTFSAGDRASTVTFTASEALKTVGSSPSNFFIVLDISAGAQEGYDFSIRISTPSDLTLGNPLDTVALSTWPFIADYILDFSIPAVSDFATLSSTGGWLGESQWTRLTTGVTARVQAQDLISGLSMSTGAFSVQYSTNAGATWTVIVSTTAGAAPYLAWSGVNGSTEAQTLTAYNLAVVQSTNTQICGGSACGATNQIRFGMADSVGNQKTAGPYAVLADTTPPSGISAASAGIGDSTVSVSVSANDGVSGIRDYNYELSTSAAFDSGVSSSNFTGNSFTFTGLNDGTTYYLRAYARDNAYNLSDPSAVVSTMTSGILYFTAQSTAPAWHIQGGSAASLLFDLNVNSGRATLLQQVQVAKLGNIPDSDIAAVYVYRDDGDGTFGPGDSQIGNAAVVAGTATINITPQTIDNAGKRFFAVYALSASAGVGKTIGARLVAASDLTVAYPFRAVGTFPANSTQSTVVGEPNILAITPSSLTAGVVQAGVLNLPAVKLLAQTDTGSSRLDRLIVRLGGTAPANYISAVKIYQDSNSNNIFDGGDTLVTSGGDTFSAGDRTSTVTFTASDALRTAGSTPSSFFITLDISGGAQEAYNFSIRISTPSDLTLGNPLDTVAFSTWPFIADYILDFSSPAVSGFATLSSTGGWLGESQWTRLATGVTARVQAQDLISGLSMSTGAFSVQYSTNAGATWSAISSTVAGSAPYLGWSGVNGSTEAQTLTAYNLAVVQSTNTQICGGAACGATNQFKFTVRDMIGNTRISSPYAVLADTTPPAGVSAAPAGIGDSAVSVSASAGDGASGVRDYNYELSPSEAFDSGVSSSNFTGNSFTFTGLDDGTTYYLRAYARDNVDNLSDPSAVVSTMTSGIVYFTAQSTAPSSLLQGTSVAFLIFDVNTNAGRSANLSQVKVAKLGNIPNTDIAAAYIYRDDGDGTFGSGDSQIGSAVIVAGTATINVTPQLIDNAGKRFFVVYKLSASAGVGKTIGVRLVAASNLTFTYPFRAVGTFPSDSISAIVADGPNILNIVPSNLAPGIAQPGVLNLPVIKFAMQTDQGISRLDKLILRFGGTASANFISAVKIYRDSNLNGVFDGGDTLVTSGGDTFSADERTSTVAFTASDALRTVGSALSYFFVTLDVSNGAVEGNNFNIGISTASDFSLGNSSDTVAFSMSSFTSATTTIVLYNAATINLAATMPAEVSQGISYQVAIATLNVDVGITQLSRIRVNRTGFGSDLDAVVSIYLDSTKDGGPLNTTADLFLGSASFSGGVATINITTVTITAGFDSVLFYALNIAPLANPTNTIGISVTNADYLTMPSYTISKTVTPLPFNTGTAPIKATVNKLMLAAVSDITTGSIYEGAVNYPMLKLSFATDRNQAILTAMRVDKTGTLADNLVTALNIFRDEDDSGDYGAGDTLVTQSAGLFSNGSSNLSFTEPQIIGATRTYFVALSVSPNAETGYTIGLQAANTAYFTVTAPNYMSTSAVSYPVAAGPVGVQAYPNTVTISTAGIYSSGVYPGQSNVPIFKLTARADISRAKILSMKFDQAGTSSDSDIAAVKIYYDVNNRGYFDPNSLSNYVQVTPSTVAFGSDGTMGAAFLNISTAAQTITTLPINYFLVVDIAAGAAVGKTLIVRALNSASFTVNAPNSVAVSPLGTSAITIQAPQQTLYASFQNQLSTWVAQGQNTILVSSFTVYASSYAIDMTEIDVMRAGTGYDSDIPEIRLYGDSGNGLWGGIGEETLVSTAAFYDNIAPLYVSGSVGQSRKTYYIVANVATNASYGRTFGITVPTPNYIRVNSPHLVSAAAFPFIGSLAVINPTIDTLSITPTDSSPGLRQGDTDKVMGKLVMAANQNSATMVSLRLDKNGTLPDADITAVKVWEDNGDGNFSAVNDSLAAQSGGFTGGYSSLSFLPSKVIGLAGKTFFITVSVAELAEVGATFGITAPAQNFNVAAPDILSVAGSTAVFTTVGTLSDDPDILYTRLTDKASASLYQGTFNNYMGKLEFWTNRDRAVINTMRVGFSGSVSPSDIAVKLYKDTDGDGLFNSTYDVLAGSAQVSGDSSSLDFGGGLNLTASTATFFLMMDISGSAGIGATAGLAFTNETSLTLSGVDTVAPFSGIATTVGTIRDAKIPTPPVLRVYKANGEIFASEAAIYNPYKTRMRFSWESSVMAGDIEQVYYYMGAVQADGNTPGSSWTGGGINRDLWATGLDLTQANNYYLCVRTKNSLGAYYSDIVCRQFTVDALIPQLASASLSVTREQNSLLINWGSASDVPSGVAYYRVEERKADSPLWVQVSATDSRTIIIGDSAMSPSGLPSSYRTSAVISRLPGTYYYRVTPVSGAGLEGTPTEPLRVDLSLSSLEAISDVSAYPNPFDSRKVETTIHLQLNMSDGAVVKIYDIYGKKVKTLDSAPDTVHDIKWDGTDSNGKKASKGIYIGVIEAAGQSVKVKIGVIH